MKPDFFFWWSVVSTIMGIILLCFSIWQYLKHRSQEEKIKAQVKVWMQDAIGVSTGLKRIVSDNREKKFKVTHLDYGQLC